MSSAVAAWREPLYLDTSALIKLVVPDADSVQLERALAARHVVVSDLALTELASVLGRRRREGILSADQAQRLYRDAVTDSEPAAGLTPHVHHEARRLLLTSSVALRTLDALHLATALAGGAVTLVSFDARLREAAKAQGLQVAP